MPQDYKIALTSRIVVYAIQLIVCHILPSHDAHVFVWDIQPSPLSRLFPGTLHWDSAHFFAIAEKGYTVEQQFAFFPLFPLILRAIAEIFGGFGIASFSLSSRLILANVLLNTIVFCKCATLLRQLATRLGVTNEKQQRLLVVLFCFNPASVFFSMAYTECLYLLFVLQILLTQARGNFLGSLGWLFLSGCTRSNGVVNAAFWLFPVAQAVLLGITKKQKKKQEPFLLLAFRAVVAIIVAFTPFLCFQLYAYWSLCKEPSPSSSSSSSGGLPLWCSWQAPLVYLHVQKHYWQVGFLTEYQLKNIPKFFLAAPIFCTSLAALRKWGSGGGKEEEKGAKGEGSLLRRVLTLQQSVYFYHLLFLLSFASFFMHIEVMTRFLLSSSPSLYLFCLEQFPAIPERLSLRSLWDLSPRAGKLFLSWFGGYYVLGTILHGLSLPWC